MTTYFMSKRNFGGSKDASSSLKRLDNADRSISTMTKRRTSFFRQPGENFHDTTPHMQTYLEGYDLPVSDSREFP